MTEKRTESLRDFLERREPELAQAIQKLRAQLLPLEKEVAEIRRTMRALEMKNIQTPGQPQINYVDGFRPFLEGIPSDSLAHQLGVLSNALHAHDNASLSRMTIKQLIFKTLFDHFPGGATAAELCDFFDGGYGRVIDRNSLSPQLSRMRDDGLIEQPLGILNEGKWSLTRVSRRYGTVILAHDQKEEAVIEALSDYSSPYLRDGSGLPENDEDSILLEAAKKLAWSEADDSASRQEKAGEHESTERKKNQKFSTSKPRRLITVAEKKLGPK
jgi:hypothetical protein